MPLPENAPPTEDRGETGEDDEWPVRGSIRKLAHRRQAASFQQLDTRKSAAHVSDASRTVEQAVEHAGVDGLVVLRSLAFQLVDDATPCRAVAAGEEAEGDGEEHQ